MKKGARQLAVGSRDDGAGLVPAFTTAYCLLPTACAHAERAP